MWLIDKTFEFDYGHRVWTQKLNSDFSIDNRCVCRHLHGHRGKVHVYLKSDTLDETGMVTDFKHLNWFKKFLDDVLDHKMILDMDDPTLFLLYSLATEHYLIENKEFNYYTVDIAKLETDLGDTFTDAEMELYEGLVIVNFVPTSENLAKWLAEITSKKMKEMGVNVSHIEFFETPKSRSTYYID